MAIEVSGTFNIELFGIQYQKSPMFRKKYRTFIFLTLVHQLNHLFAPHTLFKRGYERTDDIQRLIDDLGLTEDDEFSKLERVENVIKRYLTEFVSNDGHDFYGIYDVVQYRSTSEPGFLVRYTDDYRIVEWMAGRGKPAEEQLTEGEAANRAIVGNEDEEQFDDEVINQACLEILSVNKSSSTPSGLKIWREVPATRHQMHDVTTAEIRGKVREIEQRLTDEKYVDDEDMQFLHDHQSYR